MVYVYWCLLRMWVGKWGGLHAEACPLGRSRWGWGMVSVSRRVCDRPVRVPGVAMWQCRRGRDDVGVV